MCVCVCGWVCACVRGYVGTWRVRGCGLVCVYIGLSCGANPLAVDIHTRRGGIRGIHGLHVLVVLRFALCVCVYVRVCVCVCVCV